MWVGGLAPAEQPDTSFLAGAPDVRVGPLSLAALDKDYVCIVQLRTQPAGVVHQVTLRRDKVKETGRRSTDGLIRLGETDGDEATGWVAPGNILVLAVLGEAKEENGKWVCT